MIEELAKVVKGLEWRLADSGTSQEQIIDTLSRSLDQTSKSTKELESVFNASISSLNQIVDENQRHMIVEIGHLKKRHARLLSLYSTGLETQMSVGQKEIVKESYSANETTEGAELEDSERMLTVEELSLGGS